MSATIDPKLKPDQAEVPEWPALRPVDRTPDDPYIDATQGHQIGSDPLDDATQGRQVGSDAADDATQARGYVGH